MSKIGYYRYKVSDTVEGESSVKWFVNGSLACTHTVITKQFCDGFRLLKYLDRNGQYRFFPFNKNWQQTDKPTLIGSVNNFVTSIIDSQADKKNVGYVNERRIGLTASHVSQLELDKLTDIYYSPRVYLYIGNGSDTKSAWILVSITGDGVGKPRKDNFKKVSVDVILPAYFSITKV